MREYDGVELPEFPVPAVLGEQRLDVGSSEPAVTPGPDAVCGEERGVRPVPHCVRMYVEQGSHLRRGQQLQLFVWFWLLPVHGPTALQ